MKRNRSGTAVILMTFLMISIDLFGHGSVNVRNRCRWWNPKYVAFARVRMSPLLSNSQRDTDCTWAEAERNNGCAYQYSRASSSGNSLYGSVYHDPWLCSRGLAVDEESAQESVSQFSQTPFDEFQLSTAHPIFASSSVTVSQIQGRLYLSEKDRYNEVKLAIWLPLDDDINYIPDTVRTPAKTVWEGYIRINGDFSVTVSPNLPLSSITINRTATYAEVVINNLSITSTLPFGHDGINDDVAFSIETYGEPEPSKNNLQANTENHGSSKKDGDLVLFPNPAAQNCSILLKGEDKISYISISTMEGRIVQSWTVESKNMVEVDFEVLELVPGAYIVAVYSERFRYVQKLVVYSP